MDKTYEILIADRNPHIREFLRRELAAFGYNVRVVENGKNLLKQVYSQIRVDLLVFDPDFPGADTMDTFRKILDRIPQLPVVLYCVRGTDNFADFSGGNVCLVEKNGQSIEVLKKTIQKILSGLPIESPLEH